MIDQDIKDSDNSIEGNNKDKPKEEGCNSKEVNNNVYINDILCFISTAMNSKTNEYIIQSCMSFYEVNKIKDAKAILCSFNDERPVKRRGDEAKVNEIKDIIELIRKYDENKISLPVFAAGSFDSLPPGSGYEVISPIIIDLIDQIKLLKDEIQMLKNVNTSNNIEINLLNQLKDDMNEVKASVRLVRNDSLRCQTPTSRFVKDPITSSETRFPSRISNNNSEYKKISENVLNDDETPSASKLLQEIHNNKEELKQTETHEPNAPPLTQENDFIESQPIADITQEFLAKNYETVSRQSLFDDLNDDHNGDDKYRPSAPTLSQMNKSHTDVPSDVYPSYSFVTKSYIPPQTSSKSTSSLKSSNILKSDNKKPKLSVKGGYIFRNSKTKNDKIVGSKEFDSGFKFQCANNVLDLYVGNCSLNVTSEVVKEYILVEKSINVIDCIELESRNKNKRSFKISVKAFDRDNLLDATMWPSGILCRKFRNIKYKNNK